jgi:hypothetical protein
LLCRRLLPQRFSGAWGTDWQLRLSSPSTHGNPVSGDEA